MQDTWGQRLTHGRRAILLTSVSAMMSLGMPAVCFAQATSENQNAQSSAGDAPGIQDIVVTAAKRSENLRDVPAAISALSGADLSAKGISNALQLQFAVPGVSIGDDVFGGANVVTRGVGSVNLFPGGDPGVPIHIDGHYIQSTAFVLRDFLDVNRVEVLRGPQGTLYGRNAVGGSINVVTNRPTSDFEGALGVGIGNYGKRLVDGFISGPLADGLNFRIAGATEKRDGYVTNLSRLGAQDIQNSDYASIRGALAFEPNSAINLDLSGYYFRDVGNTAAAVVVTPYPTSTIPGFFNHFADLGVTGINPTTLNPWMVSNNSPYSGSHPYDKAAGASLDIGVDVGFADMKSLSSYNWNRKRIQIDLDGSDLVTQDEEDTTEYKTFTQEIQLVSKPNSRVKWIIGGFYYNERSSQHNDLTFDNFFSAVGPVSKFVIDAHVKARSLGVFGQVTYPITNSFEIVAGGRYNSDRKSLLSTLFSPDIGAVLNGGPAPAVDGSRSWQRANYKAGLNFKTDGGTLLYVSFSTGYKSGGFNLLQASPYNPERVNAIEAGLKAVLLDNRLSFNGAVFHYDYRDKQERTRDGFGVINLINAAKAKIEGAEVEVTFRPISSFQIDGSLAYLNAKYSDFSAVDENLLPVNYKGNYVTASPKLKGHLGIQYSFDLGAKGELRARADGSWVDGSYSNYLNRARDLLGGYGRYDARLTWVARSNLWQIEAYVRNLTNGNDLANSFEVGAVAGLPTPEYGQYLPPRTYGVKITRRF